MTKYSFQKRCNAISKLILLFAVGIFLVNCMTLPASSSDEDVVVSGTQQFTIPRGAELLESTELKDNGVSYIIERRYKLPSGKVMYAYYDIEGGNSVTIQRVEQTPIIAMGTDVNIPSMPGYREFNFGDDRRKLVQFMKLFKLGERTYRGGVKTPSLSDNIFRPSASFRNEFKLLLDLYDETWVLEHREFGMSGY
ncbi:MAG: hypothetical protein LBD48_10740, partial [Treponema sp.]|nr:hypothetical protein [Treponema sp.]